MFIYILYAGCITTKELGCFVQKYFVKSKDIDSAFNKAVTGKL